MHDARCLQRANQHAQPRCSMQSLRPPSPTELSRGLVETHGLEHLLQAPRRDCGASAPVTRRPFLCCSTYDALCDVGHGTRSRNADSPGCDSKHFRGKGATRPQWKRIDTELLAELLEQLTLRDCLTLGLGADLRERRLRRILSQSFEPSRQPRLHLWRRLRRDCVLDKLLRNHVKPLKFDSRLAEPNDSLICCSYVDQRGTDSDERSTRNIVVCLKDRQDTEHEQCNGNDRKECADGDAKPGLGRLGKPVHPMRLSANHRICRGSASRARDKRCAALPRNSRWAPPLMRHEARVPGVHRFDVTIHGVFTRLLPDPWTEGTVQLPHEGLARCL